MEIIYLALHRLGTDRLHARLQAWRPPKKQWWGGQTHLQNGTSAAWALAKARTSVRCALESGDTKRLVTQKERYRSGAASCPPGRKRRLHGSQVFTLQKSKSLKTKSLRDLVQNSPPSACRALVARSCAEHTEHTEHTEHRALARKSRAPLRTVPRAAQPRKPTGCRRHSQGLGTGRILRTPAAAGLPGGGSRPCGRARGAGSKGLLANGSSCGSLRSRSHSRSLQPVQPPRRQLSCWFTVRNGAPGLVLLLLRRLPAGTRAAGTTHAAQR